MRIDRVQVATTVFNEPTPGVVIDTELGDVIFILDRPTGTMGIHAPGDMPVDHLIVLIDIVNEEYGSKGIDPYTLDDTVPMLFEENFIFHNAND